MKKTALAIFFVVSIAVCAFFIYTIVPLPSDSPVGNITEKYKPLPYYKTADFKSTVTLNYCAYSIFKIKSSNSKIVLDNEYSNTIGVINLQNLDLRIASIIEQYIDTLKKFSLSENEKKKLIQMHEKGLQKSILNELMRVATISNITAVTSSVSNIAISTASMSGIAAQAASVHPVLGMLALGGTVIYAASREASSLYAIYQDNYQKIEDPEWVLSVEAIEELNDVSRLLRDAYRLFTVPEQWRMTEMQFGALISTSKEPDAEKRHRMLERIEKDSRYIPVYWYLRAEAAHAAAMAAPAQKAVYAQDIRKCVEFYEKYSGFLRRGELYASILMFDIANNEYLDNILLEKLQYIIAYAPSNSSKRLFVAQVYIDRGFFEMAVEHLQANLDVNEFEVLSRKLLADALAASNDTLRLQRLVTKTIEDKSASNQEVLYQLGRLPDLEIPESFISAIAAIEVNIEEAWIGNASLQVVLPQEWVLGEDQMQSTLVLAEQVYTPQRVSASRDGASTLLRFNRVLDFKAALALPQAQEVHISLMTEYFPVQLQGRLVPVSQEEANTWLTYAVSPARWFRGGADTEQPDNQDSPPSRLVFILDEIRTTGACFRLDEERRLSPCA